MGLHVPRVYSENIYLHKRPSFKFTFFYLFILFSFLMILMHEDYCYPGWAFHRKGEHFENNILWWLDIGGPKRRVSLLSVSIVSQILSPLKGNPIKMATDEQALWICLSRAWNAKEESIGNREEIVPVICSIAGTDGWRFEGSMAGTQSFLLFAFWAARRMQMSRCVESINE